MIENEYSAFKTTLTLFLWPGWRGILEKMKNLDNLGYELIGFPKTDISVNQSFGEEIGSGIDCFL